MTTFSNMSIPMLKMIKDALLAYIDIEDPDPKDVELAQSMISQINEELKKKEE